MTGILVSGILNTGLGEVFEEDMTHVHLRRAIEGSSGVPKGLAVRSYGDYE